MVRCVCTYCDTFFDSSKVTKGMLDPCPNCKVKGYWWLAPDLAKGELLY